MAGPAQASSHREAPLISQDPTADNTDLYTFRDPGNPAMLDIVANYIGLELPQGGPNFAKFGDDVLYEIHIDNNGDVEDDITYQFRFRTTVLNGNTFLYNTGPLSKVNDSTQNVQQVYSVQRIDAAGPHMLVTNAPTPPVNIGPRSTCPVTPQTGDQATCQTAYESKLAAPAITSLPGGGKVFAGQREDPFFVDLGSIFDLLALRPIQSNHAIHPPENAAGVDGLAGYNVHVIALQVPIASVLAPGANPACTGTTTMNDKSCVLGVYAAASRQRVKVLSVVGDQPRNAGRFVQVSRLGIPLVNEVLIPLGQKDLWNGTDPADDAQFFGSILDPEPTRLLPVLYPGVFNASNTPKGGAANRPDLIALLTGQLAGLSAANALPPADLLRVNTSTPVTASPNREGAAGGDAQGFPNGRRLGDDIVDIEIQVLAGALLHGGISAAIPGTGSPGVPYSALSDGVNGDDVPAMATFPYVATPFDGYHQQVPGHAAP